MAGKEDQAWTHRRRVEEREFEGLGMVALARWRIAGIGRKVAGYILGRKVAMESADWKNEVCHRMDII